MLDTIRDLKKTIGVRQTLKALQKGKIKLIYIAKDADEKVTVNLRELCNKHSIEIRYIESMKQLGKACGIDVGASSAGIFKE